MIKVKKKNNPEINDIYAIKVMNTKVFTIAHLIYVYESEGYYSLTFAFFDYQFKAIKNLRNYISEMNLSKPFMVATVDVNPLKEWELIGKNKTNHHIDIESNLSSHGWYMNSEIGIYPILESYFGIYPWDLTVGKCSLNEMILSGEPSKYARFLNDFTEEEVSQLGIINLIKYAGRLGELKKS